MTRRIQDDWLTKHARLRTQPQTRGRLVTLIVLVQVAGFKVSRVRARVSQNGSIEFLRRKVMVPDPPATSLLGAVCEVCEGLGASIRGAQAPDLRGAADVSSSNPCKVGEQMLSSFVISPSTPS